MKILEPAPRRRRRTTTHSPRRVAVPSLVITLLLSSIQVTRAEINKVGEPVVTQADVIHELETKLERDIKRFEKDAARGQLQKHHNSTHSSKNNITRLDKDLVRVRTDVKHLIQAIEEAETQLEHLKSQVAVEQLELRQESAKIKAEKILDQLHSGKLGIKVDYVTGDLIRPARVTGENNATQEANNITGFVSHDADKDNMAASLEELLGDDAISSHNENERVSADHVEIELNDDFKLRVRQEIEYLRSGADPATFSIDFELLLDIVKLAMTAAFFGLVAVFLRLPPTAGFLFGGMVVGPSCFDLIGSIHQVQTLAQFGIIFLLFEQGLLYSQTYSGAAVLGSTLATGRVEELPEAHDTIASPKNSDKLLSRKGGNVKKASKASPFSSSPSTIGSTESVVDHDPNVVGGIVLVLLVFTTLAIVVLLDVAASVQEAVVVACAIAICSTTIVSENLHAAHIASSVWGKGVLKMIAMHDLFMVPLLALPEVLSFIGEFVGDGSDDDDGVVDDDSTSLHSIAIQAGLITGFLGFSLLFAKRVIGAANLAQARMMGAKGELFTLSVVAYALLIASLSEKLKLSIEVGAVLAGIILMKSPYVPKVLASIQPITSVFGGMYLTSLGMIISPSFVAQEAASIVQLVCLIGMFKLVLVSTTLNRFFDYGITASLAVGSAMAQISETSLLVLAKAQRLGLVTRQTYLLLIPTTCIMLTMAPVSAAHLCVFLLSIVNVMAAFGRISQCRFPFCFLGGGSKCRRYRATTMARYRIIFAF